VTQNRKETERKRKGIGSIKPLSIDTGANYKMLRNGLEEGKVFKSAERTHGMAAGAEG